MPQYKQSMFVCKTCNIPKLVGERRQDYCINCDTNILRQRGSIEYFKIDYVCCLTRFDYGEISHPAIQFSEQNSEPVCRRTTNITQCKINQCIVRGPLAEIVCHARIQHTEHVYDLQKKDNTFIIPNGRNAALILQYDKRVAENEVYWLFMDTITQQMEPRKQVFLVMVHEGKVMPNSSDNQLLKEYSITNTQGYEVMAGNICHRMLDELSNTHRNVYLAGYGDNFGDKDAKHFYLNISNETLHLTNKLKKLLRCIICKDIMNEPIKVCPNNHSMCGACVPNNCPRCNAESCKFVRNLSLEEMSSNIETKCPYDYCTVSAPKRKIKSHDICPFQPAPCLVCDQDYIRYNTLKRHIQKRHMNLHLHMDCIMDVKIDRNFHFWYINAYNEVFGLTLIRENGKVIMGFHHLTNMRYTPFVYTIAMGTDPVVIEYDKVIPTTTHELKAKHLQIQLSSNSLQYPDFYECAQLTNWHLNMFYYPIVIKIGVPMCLVQVNTPIE